MTADSARGSSNDEPGSLLVLAALSLVAGAAAGTVGALFRLSLEAADAWRDLLFGWAHGYGAFGLLFVVFTGGATTALAAWLVRRFSPHASGSGIPHVEAVLQQELPPAPWLLVPVKFVGGMLAMGAGLALGREGPSVQMGATLAHLVGRLFRRHWPDCRVLLAAGAGAGLATAFNAPIAGAVFVLEELLRRFETRIAIAALGASLAAITVARWMLGDAPDFQVMELPYPTAAASALYVALGALAGVVAIAYNAALLQALAAGERLKALPVEFRAALVGVLVAIIAWFAPRLVGGGEALTQTALSGTEPLRFLPLVFLVRFALGPISYAARTPGGLFAPLLVLGAQLGLLFGGACRWAWPQLDVPVEAFAVVGMAAFFTGVVRAPLTGIALIIEMTASMTLMLPMVGATFLAMLVPTLLGNPPIYESLRERPDKLA